MSLLENLKAIFNFDISKLESIHFNVLSGNNLTITVNKTESKVLNLDSPENQKKLRDLVDRAVEDHGSLIESRAELVVEGIQESDNNPPNKMLLEYFQDKISPYDLGILRAALYIKERHEKGESVVELIERLDASFGARGRNISKLCSASYFVSVIKPLYEEMSQDDTLDKQTLNTKFLERFDVLVDDSPFAIFVHGHMTEVTLIEEILRKIATNKAYGIRKMNLHGIGSHNVSLIQRALEAQEVKNEITDISSIEKKANVMSVTIRF